MRCEICEIRRGALRHHVIYKQELARRRLPRRDSRCLVWICKRCHDDHHGPNYKIPLTKLRDETIAYAFEVLDAFAYDYLRRRYAGDDPRLDHHLQEAV